MDVFRDDHDQYLVVISDQEDEVYRGPGSSLAQIFIDGPDGNSWDPDSLPQLLGDDNYEWVNPEDGSVVELTRLYADEYMVELKQEGDIKTVVVTKR